MYDGRVVRDPSIKFSVSSFWKCVDWKRVVSLFLPVFLLVVTNPANIILSTTKTFSQPSASASSSALPSSLLLASSWFVVGRPRITNYGVFALQESLDGVTVLAVLSESSVCSFNDVRTRRGAFCEAIADTLCHRKPLLLSEYWYDERSSMTANHRNNGIKSFASALAKDRVFLVHRLICWILILTASFNFCCPRFPPRRILSGYLFYHPIIDDLLTSVLFSSSSSSSSSSNNNNLVRDLLRHNFIIYPVLVELDRMVPQMAYRQSGWWYWWILRPTGKATADFLLTVVLLILLAGAANVLASRITNQQQQQQHHRVVGFSSCTAAGLGYLQRCAHHQNNRSWILLAFGTQTLPVLGRNYTAINTVQVFWSSMAWMVVSSDNWYPMLVVWLVGGVVGTLLAEFHLQHISTAVGYYQDFLRYIGF